MPSPRDVADHSVLQAQPTAGAPRDRGIVRDHDEREALVVQSLEHPEYLVPHALVEVAGRFVGQQHPRTLDDGPRDCDALLLTPGELPRPVVGALRETDAAQRIAHAVALYRLNGVTRTYSQKGREITALVGVDLQIEAGDFITIQGPTGGGKSTLLQLLGALDRPSTGSVHLGELDIATADNRRLGRIRAHEIGFVFQGFNLIPTLTASENVDMALEPLRLAAPERRATSSRSPVSALRGCRGS